MDPVRARRIEATSTAAADSGNVFRYGGNQYIVNLGTKSLSAGTWGIGVDLTDGVGVKRCGAHLAEIEIGSTIMSPAAGARGRADRWRVCVPPVGAD